MLCFNFKETDMQVIEAPNPLPNVANRYKTPTVFLAGSIEMGTAVDWQADIIEFYQNDPVTFLNPRRSDWDSSWEQSKDNPKFREQVEWELNAQDMANFIFMYFAPGTKSPISLLELGLFAYKRQKMVVCCPNEFWRKGNVDIVCERHNIPCFDNFERAKMTLLGMIHSWNPTGTML
jgi:hypothetical protein